MNNKFTQTFRISRVFLYTQTHLRTPFNSNRRMLLIGFVPHWHNGNLYSLQTLNATIHKYHIQQQWWHSLNWKMQHNVEFFTYKPSNNGIDISYNNAKIENEMEEEHQTEMGPRLNKFICLQILYPITWLDMTCLFSVLHWSIEHWTIWDGRADGAVNGLFGERDPFFRK